VYQWVQAKYYDRGMLTIASVCQHKKNKFVKYADKPTTYDECWYPQTVMGEYWQHSKCYVCNALIIQSHVNRDKAHRTYTDFENICPFTLKFNNASTYM